MKNEIPRFTFVPMFISRTMNLKTTLRVSGISYLMIFLTGFYANFFVLEAIVVSTDPITTVTNFIEYRPMLRAGILGFLAMLFFDVVLVGSLYYVTNKVNRRMTILASGFRMLHALAFAVALASLFHIYGMTDPATGLDLNQLEPKITLALENFDSIWTLGLLFFGVHLFLLGYLCIKSNGIAKGLGVMLLLAALGYLTDCSAKLFMGNYVDYQEVFGLLVIILGVVGELTFTIWLLFKGFFDARLESIG